MAFDKKQFKRLIEETLDDINMNSEAAVNLLLGTAAQESHFGTYLRQVGGPALGAFEMEPATYRDIWANYLFYRPKTAEAIRRKYHTSAGEMVHNLKYAIVMARLHYRRVPEPLPEAHNVLGLAIYWKKHYNTHKGKGTTGEFLRNYNRFVK